LSLLASSRSKPTPAKRWRSGGGALLATGKANKKKKTQARIAHAVRCRHQVLIVRSCALQTICACSDRKTTPSTPSASGGLRQHARPRLAGMWPGGKAPALGGEGNGARAGAA
jgi:hypothetical protein